MKFNLILILFCLFQTNLSAQNIESRYSLYEGNNFFDIGDYDNALNKYVQSNAFDINKKSIFNAGNASFMKNDFETASDFYLKYLNKCENKNEKSDAYYNIGNAKVKIWFCEEKKLESIKKELIDAKIEENLDIKEKMEKFLKTDSLLTEQKKAIEKKDNVLNEAIENYKNAIRNMPTNNDARYNLSYVIRLLPENADKYNDKYQDKEDENKEEEKRENKKEISENGKKIKQKTFDLIEENKFIEAHEHLSTGIKNDESLKTLEDLNKKLKTLNDILK